MRLPSIAARDVIKKLKNAGFVFDRQSKGSAHPRKPGIHFKK